MMRQREVFLRPIAHRGLHGAPGGGAVENTMAAFVAARDKGYGIECDLRPGFGGLPLVFHDEDLARLISADGPVAKLKAEDLASFAFRNAPDQRIPTFAELLALIDSTVPLLVEIKSEWTPPDHAFLSQISQLANAYTGPIALMSFDPDLMSVLREMSPQIPRGIVSGNYLSLDRGAPWWRNVLSPERAERLTHLLDSGPAEPSFFAYDVKSLPTPVTRYVRAVERKPIFTWTVRDDADRANAAHFADAPIFEGFLA
ncbi:MAG: glycerophosphodiester phosphodiesterase family protein [Hyphomicrobiaceae bacterium]